MRIAFYIVYKFWYCCSFNSQCCSRDAKNFFFCSVKSQVSFIIHAFVDFTSLLRWKINRIKKCIKKGKFFFCGYPLSYGLIHIHAWRHIKTKQRSGECVSCSRHQCLLIIYCSYFHVTPVSCIYFSSFPHSTCTSIFNSNNTPHTNIWACWMRIEWNVARHGAGKQKVNNLAAYKWCFLYVLIFQVSTEKTANNKLRTSWKVNGLRGLKRILCENW